MTTDADSPGGEAKVSTGANAELPKARPSVLNTTELPTERMEKIRQHFMFKIPLGKKHKARLAKQ